jgi:hypothetical protein
MITITAAQVRGISQLLQMRLLFAVLFILQLLFLELQNRQLS